MSVFLFFFNIMDYKIIYPVITMVTFDGIQESAYRGKVPWMAIGDKGWARRPWNDSTSRICWCSHGVYLYRDAFGSMLLLMLLVLYAGSRVPKHVPWTTENILCFHYLLLLRCGEVVRVFEREHPRVFCFRLSSVAEWLAPMWDCFKFLIPIPYTCDVMKWG